MKDRLILTLCTALVASSLTISDASAQSSISASPSPTPATNCKKEKKKCKAARKLKDTYFGYDTTRDNCWSTQDEKIDKIAIDARQYVEACDDGILEQVIDRETGKFTSQFLKGNKSGNVKSLAAGLMKPALDNLASFVDNAVKSAINDSTGICSPLQQCHQLCIPFLGCKPDSTCQSKIISCKAEEKSKAEVVVRAKRKACNKVSKLADKVDKRIAAKNKCAARRITRYKNKDRGTTKVKGPWKSSTADTVRDNAVANEAPMCSVYINSCEGV